MRSMTAQRPLVIALVGALVVVVVGTIFTHVFTKPSVAPVVIEPIASSVLLCPEPGAGSQLGVRVTAAVVPGQPGQRAGSGSAGLQTLPGAHQRSVSIRTPGGQAEVLAFGTKLPPIRAFGEGNLAPGFIADQWGRAPRGAGRGMASTACAPAGADFWFVGGGAVAGRVTKVVLVNPDDSPAVVDVQVLGPQGLLSAPGGRGLVVPASSRTVVRLDVLAPGVKATALHVIARSGRVGASVEDQQLSGLNVIGTDWIPAAAPPSTDVYVPGVMPGKGARVLSIAAPGQTDATVNLRVLTPSGSFAPADRSTITVPGQSVVNLDLSSVIGQVPATLQLSSSVPVVAGMREFFGTSSVQDETAYSAGAQPLTTTAAVSGLPVRPSTNVSVAVSAPAGDVTVKLELLPYTGGSQASAPTSIRLIHVPSGQVVNTVISTPNASWFTAVVTPQAGSGPYLVAHEVRESSSYGDLVTGYPWPALRTLVQVPHTTGDPALSVQ